MTMQDVADTVNSYLIKYGMNLLAALLIFLIGKWVANIVTKIIENTLLRAKIEKTLVAFAKTIIYFGFMTFVVIAALGQLGIQTTSFIAVLGAAGLAVGLALQGSLANFASGVLLILFRTFKVGDVIEVAGVLGTVQEIQIFNTIMSTPDKKKVIVPNSKITSDKIIVH